MNISLVIRKSEQYESNLKHTAFQQLRRTGLLKLLTAWSLFNNKKQKLELANLKEQSDNFKSSLN